MVKSGPCLLAAIAKVDKDYQKYVRFSEKVEMKVFRIENDNHMNRFPYDDVRNHNGTYTTERLLRSVSRAQESFPQRGQAQEDCGAVGQRARHFLPYGKDSGRHGICGGYRCGDPSAAEESEAHDLSRTRATAADG